MKWTSGMPNTTSDIKFRRHDLYAETYRLRILPHPALRKKFREFMEIKRHNPQQPFGSSDRPFLPGGFFASQVPGLRHAHVTDDLSIVYRIQGNEIYLYGFFKHDDIGTGQPPNTRRQKSMATRFANMQFS